MARYHWTGTHAYRDHANGRVIEPGEELPADVAEQIAAAHPHDVEAIDESDDRDDDHESLDAVEPPVEPGDHTVDELRAALEDGDFTDEELAAIQTAERTGKGRSSALDAIDAALGDE